MLRCSANAERDEWNKLSSVYTYAKSHVGLTEEDIEKLYERMLD